MIESPFAILAKDNDICWGGGRPDDITVIVSRVIDPAEEQLQAFSVVISWLPEAAEGYKRSGSYELRNPRKRYRE